jgi:hypothetical protein
MAPRWIVLGVVVASALLTGGALFILPVTAAQDASNRTFTPDQLAAIARKQEYLASLGIDETGSPTIPGTAGKDDPVNTSVDYETTTKDDLLAAWQRDYDEMVAAIGAGAAGHIDSYEGWRFRDALKYIKSLPDGPVDLPIDVQEMGYHSIKHSPYTWDSGHSQRIDPINMIFYNVGSPYDVYYDMTHYPDWTQLPWIDPGGCGSTQYMKIYDDIHAGGWIGWESQQYQLADRDIFCYWPGPEPRFHMRVFGSFVWDSHGVYGWWSVGDAHYDEWGHDCGDALDQSQIQVQSAFVDPDTWDPLWFVGGIWSYWAGNFLAPDCGDRSSYSGYGTKINLIA